MGINDTQLLRSKVGKNPSSVKSLPKDSSVSVIPEYSLKAFCKRVDEPEPDWKSLAQMPVASQLSLPEYLTLRNCVLFGKYFGGLIAYLVLEKEPRRRFFIYKIRTEYHIPKNKGERSDIILHPRKGQLVPIMGL